MTSQLLEVQNKFTDTLQEVQQQSFRNSYMNDLQTCTADNPDGFNSWPFFQ